MLYETVILVVSVVAALLTFELDNRFRQGAVKSSAAVAILFGVPVFILSALVFGFDNLLQTIPLAAIGASFAGMSSENVIPSRFWMAVSGAIFAAVFLASSPEFAGNGGLLGISACVAVIITIGLMRLCAPVRKHKNHASR